MKEKHKKSPEKKSEQRCVDCQRKLGETATSDRVYKPSFDSDYNVRQMTDAERRASRMEVMIATHTPPGATPRIRFATGPIVRAKTKD